MLVVSYFFDTSLQILIPDWQMDDLVWYVGLLNMASRYPYIPQTPSTDARI